MSQLFRTAEEARGQFGPSVVTMGNFDGVHIGHRHLVETACEIARERGWASGVLTFDPHPRRVLLPGQPTYLLTTLEERVAHLESLGAQRIMTMPFTRAVAQLTPEEFVQKVLSETLGARAVVVGDNFRFGHRQAGTCETLKELGGKLGFEVHFVPQVRYRGDAVSSSLVRRLIQRGAVARAGRLLGRCYALTGQVVKGQGIGSKQTVPTLNLATDAEVLPAKGVYITSVTDLADGRQWPSITNVGMRPTFDGTALTIESYLLTALEGGTPEGIRVEFRRWVREERKFADAGELRTQILKDVGRARAYWRRVQRLERRPAAKAGFRPD